jgi:uncharacterized membrane-anchored protein YhcB (DUF1043 family)
VTQEIQTILRAGIPTLAIVIGIIVDNVQLRRLLHRLGKRNSGFNARVDDLRSHVDQHFDDLEKTLRADFRRMAERLR